MYTEIVTIQDTTALKYNDLTYAKIGKRYKLVRVLANFGNTLEIETRNPKTGKWNSRIIKSSQIMQDTPVIE